MTMRLVATSVSQATRLEASPERCASSTASEIWSQTLSGWPSETDSEVKMNSSAMAALRTRHGKGGQTSLFGEVAGNEVAERGDGRVGIVAFGLDHDAGSFACRKRKQIEHAASVRDALAGPDQD